MTFFSIQRKFIYLFKGETKLSDNFHKKNLFQYERISQSMQILEILSSSQSPLFPKRTLFLYFSPQYFKTLRKWKFQFQITTHPVKTSALTYLSSSPTPSTLTSIVAVCRRQRRLAMNKTFWSSGEIRYKKKDQQINFSKIVFLFLLQTKDLIVKPRSISMYIFVLHSKLKAFHFSQELDIEVNVELLTLLYKLSQVPRKFLWKMSSISIRWWMFLSDRVKSANTVISFVKISSQQATFRNTDREGLTFFLQFLAAKVQLNTCTCPAFTPVYTNLCPLPTYAPLCPFLPLVAPCCP